MGNFKWNFWRKKETYIGESGSSVIEYVIVNDKAREEVEIMTEGERAESDHMSLEIDLIGPKGISRREEKKTEMEIERSDWTEEGIKSFQEKCAGWRCIQNGTEDIWKEIEGKIKNAITKHRRKILPWKLGRREWYNKEWRDKKRGLRRALRDLKKEKKGRICPKKKGT